MNEFLALDQLTFKNVVNQTLLTEVAEPKKKITKQFSWQNGTGIADHVPTLSTPNGNDALLVVRIKGKYRVFLAGAPFAMPCLFTR